MRSELLDATGRPVLTIPEGGLERHEELTAELAGAAVGPDYAVLGRLRLMNDTLVVPTIAAVLEGNRPIGFVVRWRRISNNNSQAREQLTQLLGSNASLYIGNDRGDLWTDLSGVGAKPPVDMHMAPGGIREYRRPGGVPMLASARAVHGAPLMVLVELSRDALLVPAIRYRRLAIGIGALVLMIGLVATWLLSRSITKPLGELTMVASAFARGASTVGEDNDPGRGNEITRLSDAFDVMVHRVGEAQQGLEQRVRERTVELEERNEELETFAHTISHDLRAPLRAMHGFSQALIEDYGGRLDTTGQGYAQRVVTAASRMDLLIQDLLAYSRISRADIDLASVDLNEVARDALGQLESDLSATGGSVNVASELPAVIGHRPTLVQAVVNLVGNGLKFVPHGRTPSVRVRADKSNGVMRLWVEDNGIGIDSAHHERVFGIFQRLHQNEDYPGTGIGLAIVRKSVERMGGRVGVESASGHGSKFWIELRLAGAAA